MKKQCPVFLSCAASAVLLSGCASSALLPDEPYEAGDYNLYPAPEGAYVGDTMPFVTEDGELELYYLYDTDHNGQGYHPIYKYSTPNLFEYEDRGMVLNYGLMSDPDPAIGTGSVLQDHDGMYHLFYPPAKRTPSIGAVGDHRMGGDESEPYGMTPKVFLPCIFSSIF